MKRLWRLCGLLLAIGLIAYFLWFSWQSLDLHTLAITLKNPGTLLALLLATLCYMTIYPITGMAWRQLLLRQGQSWRSGELTLLICITQLAKYIPGNIAQHASRAALALKHGMPIQPYASSVIQETLLASAASVIVGAALLVPGASASNLAEYRWALLLLLIGSGIGILLLCVDLPISKLRANDSLIRRLIRMIGGLPGPAATLKTLAAYACNYLMIGLGIWLLAMALDMADGINYALATSAFALSWVLGFLAPGAPAGLGAREGIMALILQGHGSNDQIVQLVLLARVASMSGDLLAFGCAAMYSNFVKPKISPFE
ncbi:MAG: flippase-like domain-containing protein [Betaproteobacteria bacterium]|nr:flippase-like domain-containing protein [Betaproteobacteria bacterium]MCL2886292.1 flippase-like domain-containing protein [Betaproteobacteria bacterium]